MAALVRIALFTVVLSVGLARTCEAAPDPVIASVLSAGSTVLPLGLSAGLLATGRGAQEGIRFDLGLTALAVGSIVGPSVGQIYGRGGVDAVLSFLLRAVTGSVMTAGVGLKLRGEPDAQSAGTALTVIGAIPTGLLALYDIIGAARSARQARYDEGHAGLLLPPDLAGVLICGPIPCAL